ncbi:MAG: 30S ribosomal protein S9 [Dehalococcoidia bacterium]|nr:MAG: 30S ribosomal protein S9 [Dehalococcoidia bacterium]
MVKKTYSGGTGRRKTAVAQVRLSAGTGTITVDGKSYEERFPRFDHRQSILKPLMVTETSAKYDIVVKVSGGGSTGQADSIALGISRALLKEDEKHKAILRKEGMLTRDPRAKERKKPGLKRARKASQYTKR